MTVPGSASSKECSSLSLQPFPNIPGLGRLPFFLFSPSPRGLIVSCETQTFGFTVDIHYHFMKREMQAPVVPLGDRSSGKEGGMEVGY